MDHEDLVQDIEEFIHEKKMSAEESFLMCELHRLLAQASKAHEQALMVTQCLRNMTMQLGELPKLVQGLMVLQLDELIPYGIGDFFHNEWVKSRKELGKNRGISTLPSAPISSIFLYETSHALNPVPLEEIRQSEFDDEQVKACLIYTNMPCIEIADRMVLSPNFVTRIAKSMAGKLGAARKRELREKSMTKRSKKSQQAKLRAADRRARRSS